MSGASDLPFQGFLHALETKTTSDAGAEELMQRDRDNEKQVIKAVNAYVESVGFDAARGLFLNGVETAHTASCA